MLDSYHYYGSTKVKYPVLNGEIYPQITVELWSHHVGFIFLQTRPGRSEDARKRQHGCCNLPCNNAM